LATLLGKAKRIKNQSSSNMGGNDGGTTDKGDKMSPFNEANMIFPQSMDELPDELHQKLQAKLDVDVKAFLEGCTKNRHDKVTQFREPPFGEATTTASHDSEVEAAEKPTEKVNIEVDPYLTHANFATMLEDDKKVIGNNLMSDVDMIMPRFDKIEGKTADYVDISADESPSKHPQYGMPFNFYDNQSMYAAANKTKLAALVTETNKTNLGGLVLLCE